MDKNSNLKLTTTVFQEGGAIPEQYTCKGQNINPPLNISGVPNDAKSLALIMHDPDAVGGDYMHWTMWDIPSNTSMISANSVPIGAIQGVNDAGANKYSGPCPPAGTGLHHYIFELFALDVSLGLDSKTSVEQFKSALKGHIITETKLIGVVQATY